MLQIGCLERSIGSGNTYPTTLCRASCRFDGWDDANDRDREGCTKYVECYLRSRVAGDNDQFDSLIYQKLTGLQRQFYNVCFLTSSIGTVGSVAKEDVIFLRQFLTQS